MNFCPGSYFGVWVDHKGGDFHISFFDMLVLSHLKKKKIDSATLS